MVLTVLNVFGLNIADPPRPDSGVEFETSWPVQCKKVIHVKMNEKEMSTSIPVTINGLNLNFFMYKFVASKSSMKIELTHQGLQIV